MSPRLRADPSWAGARPYLAGLSGLVLAGSVQRAQRPRAGEHFLRGCEGVGWSAQQGAGAIHSDLEHHFIRAETIRWDQLLEAGSEANARARGTLRLEGKDYIVEDGDVMHIRHSG